MLSPCLHTEQSAKLYRSVLEATIAAARCVFLRISLKFVCDAVVLVLSATISTTSSKGTKWHSLVSGAFLGVTGVGVSITLLLVAPTLQPASWAIGQYDSADVSVSGVPNVAYMSLVAMIMGQGTMIGKLGSPHSHDTVQSAGHQTISMIPSMIVSTPA